MKMQKDGRVLHVDGVVQIAAFKRNGWEEAKESKKAEPEAKPVLNEAPERKRPGRKKKEDSKENISFDW